ncbi:MAG TPA: zinc-binding dehydrogenase [Candidatus Binataceae bacterium]|nr:zinc-binding dehydrogenase [Candidatus Binataceae bacterium]
MDQMRAVVVDPNVAGRLAIKQVASPSPRPAETLVRVKAISLNLGEVRRSLTMADPGWRPGWDLAGVVEQAASDGSGPQAGARVVGFLPAGAWAEMAAVPTNAIAVLPDKVSFAQAATLPVAGLTALYSLERNGSLLGRRLLVTGASGGVGHLAVEMANHAGAFVVASVRRPEREKHARGAGAHQVVVGEDLSAAAGFGPYDLILESVGGNSLGAALKLLARGGMCVLYGVSASAETTFDAATFMRTGGASLYGFILFHEIRFRPAAEGLAQLAQMVADNKLHPQIELEAPFAQIAEVAQKLYNRGIAGKAVLNL